MKKNPEFIVRFIKACGTAEPAEIQRLLNISYQAAKNYLDGRYPHTDVLIRLSNKTPYSIDWLLTGRGKKFVEDIDTAGAPIPTRQIEAIARRVCVEVINELDGSRDAALPKVVVLQSSELMSEKVMDEAISLTGSQP